MEKQKAYWEGYTAAVRQLRSEVMSSSAYRVEFQNMEKYGRRKMQELDEQEG